MSVTLVEERTFPLQPSSASAARRFVESVLEAEPPVIESVRLAVSEIATNALLHAQTSFVVRVSRNSMIRVEIFDQSNDLPLRRETAPGDVTGRGLSIVDQLADGWGVVDTTDGKCVWFEVRASGPEALEALEGSGFEAVHDG